MRYLNAGAVTLVLLGVGALPASALDPWEAPQDFASVGDDNQSTNNSLTHGFAQTHDLDEGGAGNDQDWMAVPTIARHSYEARISGGSVAWDFGACPSCAQVERVDGVGTILQEDVGIVNDGTGITQESYDRSIRWIATVSQPDQEYLRVTGGSQFTENASSIYTVRFWDTTYSIPRWNNSGSQITVFVISNLIQVPVDGQIDFYNPGGTLLLSQPFTVGPNGLFVFNTASAPALVGFSGHAYVAHTGGYGGLAGKAVALEPTTGFSFDTPLIPIPD